MAGNNSGSRSGGRLSRFLSFLSGILLVMAIAYAATARSSCEMVQRLVFMMNDIPGRVALTVLRPFSDTSFYAGLQQFFVNNRLTLANGIVIFIYNEPGYVAMCVKGENNGQESN